MNLGFILLLGLPLLASASQFLPSSNDGVLVFSEIITPVGEVVIIEDHSGISKSAIDELLRTESYEAALSGLRHSKSIINSSNSYSSKSILDKITQLNSALGLLNIIDLILTEALTKKDPKEFATKVLNGIQTLFEEAYFATLKGSYSVSMLERSFEDFLTTILSRSSSESEDENFSRALGAFENVGKSRMMKAQVADVENEESDEKESESGEKITTFDAYEALKLYEDRFIDQDSTEEKSKHSEEEKSEHSEEEKSEHSEEEKDDGNEIKIKRKNLNGVQKRGRGGRRNVGNLAQNLASTGLNVAAASFGEKDNTGGDTSNLNQLAAIYPNNEVVGTTAVNPSAAFSDALMEQLQQQLLSQVMTKLTDQSGLAPSQIADATNLISGEREKLQEALGGDLDNMDQMNSQQVVNYLRTSAIPKLINELIREKTNVDVLKTLSRVLRVLNEGLASVEVILRILIRLNKRLRLLVLYASDVVSDMARTDNMTPTSDLAISLNSDPEINKKKGKFKTFKKMFRSQAKRGFRKAVDSASGFFSLDSALKEDPVTSGMRAAVVKAKSYVDEFSRVPSILLLRLLHTILSELDSRDGAIRAALTAKTCRTLEEVDKALNAGVALVFGAVRRFYASLAESSDYDSASLNALDALRPEIFVEILTALISTSEWDKTKLEAHIVKVVAQIKPMVYILDLQGQTRMLEFMLQDENLVSSGGSLSAAENDENNSKV